MNHPINRCKGYELFNNKNFDCVCSFTVDQVFIRKSGTAKSEQQRKANKWKLFAKRGRGDGPDYEAYESQLLNITFTNICFSMTYNQLLFAVQTICHKSPLNDKLSAVRIIELFSVCNFFC